jgi:hypothetical protein
MERRVSWWRWGLIAMVVVVCAVGVFTLVGDDEREAAGDYEKDPPASIAEVNERASRCEEVPAVLVRFIESGLDVTGGNITEKAAVRSVNLARTWLIATRIEGDDFDELAVFATDELRDSDQVFAVDGIAEDFSDWTVADGTEGTLEIELGDDGTDESLDCID